MPPSARQRRLRWVAPFGVAAVIALIVALPGLSAASTPTLPPITAAQLVAKVEQANVTHLSGTVDLKTDLGVPDLSELSQIATSGGPQSANAFDPTTLLSGSHQALVWLGGKGYSRVDLLENLAEFDVIHNGTNVWTWDSVSKEATHYTLSSDKAATTTPDEPATPPDVETPQQLADKILAHLDPTTSVTVGTPLRVANHDAYQLDLAPRSGVSTIDHVAIAVDQQTGLPLQVAIYAKEQKAAALQLGFGQISLSAPSASEFNFTPPAGATVANGDAQPPAATQSVHRVGPRRLLHLHGKLKPATAPVAQAVPATATGSTTIGSGWTTVKVFDGVQIPAQYQEYLAAGTAVSGSFGSGRLLSTALVSILVLNNGKVAVGAVNASALEAAAAAAH